MNRRPVIKLRPWAAGLALTLLAAPLPAVTVEEVIEKHIEARGGRDAWNRVETLKITGDFTGFSKVSPFTLHRKRADKYHLDYVLDDKPITIGYDGEHAWWINLWYRLDWAQKIAGADLVVLNQNLDFASPFFDYEAKGYGVELLEEGDLDGQNTIRIKLTRSEDTEETWYLDPQTYLEAGFDAQGSDFGNPMPQRTFFDDFREVDGLMIPHFIETQWYTRDRIMEIAEVETNVEIDDALFAFPLPGEMRKLQAMAGEWKVKVEERRSPEASWQESEMTSKVESRMHGSLLEERFTDSNGIDVSRTLSYDRFKQLYRLAQFNDLTAHMDIQEGVMADGRLTVSNAETDTSWQGFGRTFHQRISIFDVGEDGFKIEEEQSVDGGENWFVNLKATYSRGE